VTRSLDELAQREMKVLAHAGAILGTMEDKERRLREDGTFAESAAIHAAYVSLAEAPTSGLEALKRAAFLGWYQTAEPSCSTGVDDLDEAVLQREYELLLTCLGDDLDEEFEAMLGWYWQVAAYHFTGHGAREALTKTLALFDAVAYKQLAFSRVDLEQRGQMGHYWISIACRPD
jgi:hypothetical protein